MEKEDYKPNNNQGSRKEQYEFAATIVLAAICAVFMLAIAILIVNYLA